MTLHLTTQHDPTSPPHSLHPPIAAAVVEGQGRDVAGGRGVQSLEVGRDWRFGKSWLNWRLQIRRAHADTQSAAKTDGEWGRERELKLGFQFIKCLSYCTATCSINLHFIYPNCSKLPAVVPCNTCRYCRHLYLLNVVYTTHLQRRAAMPDHRVTSII